MTAKNDSRDLRLTRLYDASVEDVWEAWTDPEQAAQWWGPRGFTITTHSKDLRVGGHWHYTMHGPDGTHYPNKTLYLEVEEFKRLVYDHGANDDRPALFRVTVNFKKVGDQTLMDMTMTFPSPEIAVQMKKFVKDAGGNSTWDRLGEYLTKELSGKDIFIINQSFEASPEKVFAAWIKPELFARWLGPASARMEFIDPGIAEGKTSFYKMVYDSGSAMYGKMNYRKIQSPDYLEYTQIFCDEKGKPARHPHVPVWPKTILTRVLLAKEGENQTRVTLAWEPFGELSDEERQAFVAMRTDMTKGWTDAFDKLEDLMRG